MSLAERQGSRRKFLQWAAIVGGGGALAVGGAIIGRSTSTSSSNSSSETSLAKPPPTPTYLSVAYAPTEPATKPSFTPTVQPTSRPTFAPSPETRNATPTKEVTKVQSWMYEVTLPQKVSSKNLIDAFKKDGKLLFTSNANGIPIALDQDKNEVWTWEDKEKGWVYMVDEKYAYVVRPDQRIYAVNKSTGKSEWKVIPNPGTQQFLVGLPYFAGKDSVHFAIQTGSFGRGVPFLTIDKTNPGKQVWLDQKYQALELINGDALLVQDWAGTDSVHVLEAKTNALRFSVNLGDDHIVGLAQNNGETLFVTAKDYNNKYHLVSLDLATGKQRFADIPFINEVRLATKTNFYCLTYNYNNPTVLTIFDAAKGNKIAEIPGFEPQTDVIFENGGLFYHSAYAKGLTTAYDVKTGNKKWENDELRINQVLGTSGKKLVTVSVPPSQSGTIRINGVNPDNGKGWKTTLENVAIWPVLAGNRIVIANRNGLTILNAEDGSVYLQAPMFFKNPPDSLNAVDKNLVVAQIAGNAGKAILMGMKITQN